MFPLYPYELGDPLTNIHILSSQLAILRENVIYNQTRHEMLTEQFESIQNDFIECDRNNRLLLRIIRTLNYEIQELKEKNTCLEKEMRNNNHVDR
jgi:hypothetical protein